MTAEFVNAGQLVAGNQVKAGGAAVGSVEEIDVSQDGTAVVEFSIDDEDYAPLRRGTRVLIKQTSLSGIANRYVDLQLGPGDGEDRRRRADRVDQTDTVVELDQIFNLFDEGTRAGLRDFVQGQADSCADAATSCAWASPI